MKPLHILKTGGAALATSLMALVGSPVAAQGVLTAPVADWTGGQVTCHILQVILEDELGYKVKRIVMPAGPAIWEGVRSGDMDFGCEAWPSYNPISREYVAELGGDGSIAFLGEAGIIGRSSYYVPRYLVEGDDAPAKGLNMLADLNNHVDLFKTLESGDRGRLIGCPVAAWLCEDDKRLEANGINFTAVELGSETAHWAEMQAAYNRGEAFVAYAWEPHWIHAALDLHKVELPPYSEDAFPATGWSEDVTFNYGNPNMLTDHPEAAAVITNSYLTNEQQAGMILAIDVDGRDIDEVVREWMAANEDIWRAWLP
ncbi:MAG: hypothetical protein OXF74_06985 [Rhodobacteraceae bacterium]|nr:hypothetical protein [Paracoccaceae bacterium]